MYVIALEIRNRKSDYFTKLSVAIKKLTTFPFDEVGKSSNCGSESILSSENISHCYISCFMLSDF